MTKSTKIILGVTALAVVGYFIWEQTNKDKVNDSKKQNASGKADYRCPKGYTYNQGKCIPNDQTKTVINANV
jgi:hypothetical protein